MKKLMSVLLIGFAIIAAPNGSFGLSAKHNALQEKTDKAQVKPQEKAGVVKKESYTCPMHPEVVMDKPGKCPKCKMNLVKKEAAKEVYTCPMHADVVADKPGKCPKCKMNLTKKEPAKKTESKTM